MWRHNLQGLQQLPDDARIFPFTVGAVSFGLGVNLKMAVTRWSNWSADVGLRDEKQGEEG